MDLNRMGSGKELIKQLLKSGNLRTMGWSEKDQAKIAARRKNPHSTESRKADK